MIQTQDHDLFVKALDTEAGRRQVRATRDRVATGFRMGLKAIPVPILIALIQALAPFLLEVIEWVQDYLASRGQHGTETAKRLYSVARVHPDWDGFDEHERDACEAVWEAVNQP